MGQCPGIRFCKRSKSSGTQIVWPGWFSWDKSVAVCRDAQQHSDVNPFPYSGCLSPAPAFRHPGTSAGDREPQEPERIGGHTDHQGNGAAAGNTRVQTPARAQPVPSFTSQRDTSIFPELLSGVWAVSCFQETASPRKLLTGQEEKASNCARKGLSWIIGKISLLKRLSSPWQLWNPHPWRGLKAMWMHLGTWGSDGLRVLGQWLDSKTLERFSNLKDSMIQNKAALNSVNSHLWGPCFTFPWGNASPVAIMGSHRIQVKIHRICGFWQWKIPEDVE